MTFPPTRHTLIHRIAATGDEAAWGQFVADYWGPLCRFALRRGRLPLDQAEDVTAETFLVLVRNRLLARWIDQPSARLRTLLCAVLRNLLSNRFRVEQGRAELLRAQGPDLAAQGRVWLGPEEPSAEQQDAFYGAWVEELLQLAVEALFAEYHVQGKGDHFRVLYGRLCEGQTAKAVADALGWSVSQSENAYKHAVRRLRQRLEELLREHVARYCREVEEEDELQAEWGQLREHLERHGGLEMAVRNAYAGLDPRYQPQRKRSATSIILARLGEAERSRDDTGAPATPPPATAPSPPAAASSDSSENP
jgi:RNA polymerase sigma factor (sigma-70 family)